MKSKVWQTIFVILTSAIVSSIIVSATPAAAYWRESGTANCVPYGSAILENTYILNNTTSSGAGYCVIPDDADHAYASASAVQAYVYDGSANAAVTVAACVTRYGVYGTACGTSKASTGTGWKVLSMSTNGWVTHPSHFAFLYTSLPEWSKLAGWVVYWE